MAAKRTLKDVKTNNTAQVLECILTHESVSRIEISELCGLSPSTVSQAVSLLLEERMVREVCAGESTGGRRPIMLQMNPEYGCVITVEVKRSGVDAQVFDMCSELIGTEKLSSRNLTGNRLLNVISAFVDSVKSGNERYPAKVVGIGLMCQDDIPEYDLVTEFSTSLSSDLIRLETALMTRCGVPVKKELINRYSLEYYIRLADSKCANYAYINVGERITASFVINKTLIRNANDSIFDISSAVLSGNYAGGMSMPGSIPTAAAEVQLKRLSADELADKLVSVLGSALLFFPVENVFIGGMMDGLDQIVEKVSGHFQLYPVIRKAKYSGNQVTGIFARQILNENYRTLVPAH